MCKGHCQSQYIELSRGLASPAAVLLCRHHKPTLGNSWQQKLNPSSSTYKSIFHVFLFSGLHFFKTSTEGFYVAGLYYCHIKSLYGKLSKINYLNICIRGRKEQRRNFFRPLKTCAGQVFQRLMGVSTKTSNQYKKCTAVQNSGI